jgi:hypothetical protein
LAQTVKPKRSWSLERFVFQGFPAGGSVLAVPCSFPFTAVALPVGGGKTRSSGRHSGVRATFDISGSSKDA